MRTKDLKLVKKRMVDFRKIYDLKYISNVTTVDNTKIVTFKNGSISYISGYLADEWSCSSYRAVETYSIF